MSEPFKELKTSFDNGRLIPFVGAGFSMIDAAMPSWKGLIKDIATDYCLQEDDVLNDIPNYLEKAEYLPAVSG